MVRFIVKRLLALIPILLGISFVSSMLFYIVPGDIVTVMLGQHVDPLTYANVRKALGLDLPFWENFIRFIQGVFCGDLGYSYIQQRPVNQIILEAVPVSVKMGIMALLINIIVGIPAGILAAINDKRISGRVLNSSSIIIFSFPAFIAAMFMQLILGVKLGWFPVSGSEKGMLSYVLPGLALGLPLSAVNARLARASMLEVMTQEYIISAISRGLPYRRVIIKHGLRNALIPVLTNFGMFVGAFMSGFVLTETVFNLPGMGRLVFSAINARDFPVLRGILFISALFAVLTNLLVDLIYARLDPRIATVIVGEKTDAAG